MKTFITIAIILSCVYGASNKASAEHPKNSMTLEKALEVIPPKYGVSNISAEVLVEKESSGRMDAIRHEPHLMKTARKYSRTRKEAYMLASSHCAFSILGLTALDMGVSWKELYDPATCVEVGVAYFAKQKERCAENYSSKLNIVKCAARRYNGAGPMAEKYSRDFMRRYLLKLYGRAD